MTEAIRQGDIPGVQLRCRLTIPGLAAESLWRWSTEPARLARWLAEEVEAQPGETGGFRLVEGSDLEVGETVEWRPPRFWALRFRRREWQVATRLELEVRETAAGAELSVLQKGFQQLPLSDGLTLWEAYRRRWRRALERLERRASGDVAPAPGE